MVVNQAFKGASVHNPGSEHVARSRFGLAVGKGRTVYVPTVTINTGNDRAFAYAVIVKSTSNGELLWDGPAEAVKAAAPAVAPAPAAVEAPKPTPKKVEKPAPAPAPEPEASDEDEDEDASASDAAEESDDEVDDEDEAAEKSIVDQFEELNSKKGSALIKSLTDVDELAAIDAWERENKRRAGIFSAVASRLSELEDDDSDE